jgi:hypothetical protein
MADVRCPMCGKPNPEELEQCQFCQARLKPLEGRPPAKESNIPNGTQPPLESGGEQDSIDEWLSFLRQSEDEGEPRPFDEEQLADWMKEDLDIKMPESPESMGAEAAPDWLSSLRSFSDEDAPDVPEVNDTQPAAVTLPADSSEESGVPDWLSKLRSRHIAEEGEADQAIPILPGEEPEIPEQAEDLGDQSILTAASVSDWLSELRGEEAPVVESSGPTDLVAEELPAGQVETDDEAIPPGVEETSQDVSVGEADQAGEIQPQTEEIPDWLAGIVAGGAVAASAEGVEADLDNLPEWLADLEKSSALDREEIVPFGEEGEELTFDWLQTQVRAGHEMPYGEELTSDTLGTEADTRGVGPFVGDLSDFLEEAELSSLEAAQPGVEQPGEELPPAELPTWLEAMRPVDAAAGVYAIDALDGQVESSGPLAGLQGVLPAEPEIARLKKPAVYALRLQVTEGQRAHASLLDELVKSEGQPKEIAGRPAVTSPYLFRLIIFAVLISIILWQIFSGSQINPLPGVMPETFDTSEIIDNLPENALVLLGVDYDPALAGEMEAAAAALVDHMMIKGAYLSLVSTSSTGPALGEHLIATVGSLSGNQYQGIDMYANLGYLPGGASGLQAFAQAPRQVAPYALDPETTAVWNDTPMQAAQDLAGFDLVAVITDDSDKARAWVEQVQPTLNGTPLVMVISNQAEPMVRPYYQANPKQIDGMVVGLAGGGSYEQSHQDLLAGNGLARKYWDAFSLSVLSAVVLIAVGGFINLATNLLNTQKQSKADKKR